MWGWRSFDKSFGASWLCYGDVGTLTLVSVRIQTSILKVRIELSKRLIDTSNYRSIALHVVAYSGMLDKRVDGFAPYPIPRAAIIRIVTTHRLHSSSLLGYVGITL